MSVPYRIGALLAIAALLVAVWCWPLVDHSTYMDLYSGRIRSSTTVLGQGRSSEPQVTKFSTQYSALGGRTFGQERWVTCYNSGSNVFGQKILMSTMRYEGLPVYLDSAVDYLEGRINVDTGERDKLALSKEGKRVFLERMLEAARLGKDAQSAQTYLIRSTAVIWSYSTPVGPTDFPTVSQALNDATWQSTWEPLTRSNF